MTDLLKLADGRAVEFHPPDEFRLLFGRELTASWSFIAMYKWRAWGIGFEIWGEELKGIAIFIGPLAFTLATLRAKESGRG